MNRDNPFSRPRINRYRFALLIFLCTPFYAANASQDVRQGLGFSGGYVFASGLTYIRYSGPGMVSLAFAGDATRDRHDYRVSLAYGRYIHSVPRPRSLLPVALKFFVGADVRYQSGVIESDVIYTELVRNNAKGVYGYHAGPGLAIDIGNINNPGLRITLGVSYALSIENVNSVQQWEIGPLPVAAIIYSW